MSTVSAAPARSAQALSARVRLVRAGVAAGFGSGTEPSTEPGPRWPMTESASANTTKSPAQIQVTLVSSVAPARAPKAAWLLPPPKADARSPALPC